MVSRSRLKSLLTGLALYTMAAAMVGYFGVNAYTGKYGLNARQELDQEIIALTSDGRIDFTNPAATKFLYHCGQPDGLPPGVQVEVDRVFKGAPDNSNWPPGSRLIAAPFWVRPMMFSPSRIGSQPKRAIRPSIRARTPRGPA